MFKNKIAFSNGMMSFCVQLSMQIVYCVTFQKLVYDISLVYIACNLFCAFDESFACICFVQIAGLQMTLLMAIALILWKLCYFVCQEYVCLSS